MPIIERADFQVSDLTRRVTELEAKLAQMEKTLKVGPSGDVTLKAATTMTIEAGVMMQLKASMIRLN